MTQADQKDRTYGPDVLYLHQEFMKDPLANYLIKETEWRIKLHASNRYFVVTPAFDKALDLIQRYGKVIITGLPGDGKTELGLEILRHFRDMFKMNAALISSLAEWRKMCHKKQKCILLLDDIFGSDYFEMKKFDKWRPHLDNLAISTDISDCDLQNTFVVITSRKSILKEGLKNITTSRFKEERLFQEKYIIDLTKEFQLDKSHKREILHNYLEYNTENLLSKREISNILKAETPIGFPYVCKLFFSSQEFFDRGHSFFECPTEVLTEHLSSLYKRSREKYFTLSAVLLGCPDSRLDIRTLSKYAIRPVKNNTINELGVALGFSKDFDYSSIMMDHLPQVTDVYLMYNRPLNVYEFRHHSVKQAMFSSLCKRLPEFVLRFCSTPDLDFIGIEENRLHDSLHQSPDKITEFNILMERFGSEIFERPETILSLKVLRNMEFVDGYFDYLRNNGTLDNVLRWTTKDTADFLSSNQEEQFENMSSHKNSLIFFSYNNALFISRLFQHEITMYHRPSWLKEELEQTLKRASMAGHIDVIETLFAYGAAAHMNFGASFKDEITGSYNVHARPLRDSREDKFIVEDLTLVRSLVGDATPLVNRSLSSTRIDENLKVHLQNLRKFRNWSVEKKTKVMVAACEYGEVKIVQYLMQNSVSIPRNALSLCVLSKDKGYELFEYLLTVENWNEEQKVEALDTSCKVGALRHVQYLMKEGMSLTFDNLLSSVGADDNYDLIALVHGSQTWTRKQTEDATCLASFYGNVEVMRYFAVFLEETRDGFSDRCLILAALSPKPVPVFSILCQSQTSWSDKAVTEAMEIACAKLDMLLVECIVMNFKGSFGPRVLTIATKQSGEQESGIELIRFLMKEYHWDTKQKSMALSSAADQLNIPVARLLLQEGAQYQYKIC